MIGWASHQPRRAHCAELEGDSMSRLGSRTSTSSIAARVAAVLAAGAARDRHRQLARRVRCAPGPLPLVVTFLAITFLVLAYQRRRFRTRRNPAG